MNTENKKQLHDALYRIFEQAAADPHAIPQVLADLGMSASEQDDIFARFQQMLKHSQHEATRATMQQMFEQSPRGTLVFDDRFKIIYANQTYRNLWGYGKDENVLEQNPQAAAQLLPAIKQAFAGEVTILPPILYTASDVPSMPGNSRWILHSVYPLADENGAIREVRVIFEDVTDRNEAQEKLKEQEQLYRSIFEATGDGIVISDMTGKLVAANPAVSRMHGYTPEEYLALSPLQFIHPDSHHLLAAYVETVKAGREFSTQAIQVRKDGTPFYVEVHGSPLIYQGKPHILGVVRDITERVEAYRLLEQRVAERTHELATLLEVSHSVTSMLELQPLLGIILDRFKEVVENDGAAVFLLEGEENLSLLKYQGPIPQEDLVPNWSLEQAKHNREVIRTGKPVIIPDVFADTPAAQAFREVACDQMDAVPSYIATWMGVPLIVREQVIGMLTVDHGTRDFYTSHHAELALAFADQVAIAIENARHYEQTHRLAAMEERQRLARELHDSVSQALYGISLGARTARTLLDRDLVKAAASMDYVLSLADAGITEMRALLFELRPESLELEGLVAALTKQTASLRVRYNIEIAPDLCDEPDVSLDVKQAFYRIAQEAMHNTVKHAEASRIDLRLAALDGVLLLEICDNGNGFDPHGSFPGHLGLRSMRERITRLGGKLDIASAPGAGTTIRAQLPVTS